MYPDLIHDDLERQNILSTGDKVTGVFGHFLFNNVFCDPNADSSTATLYVEELIRAGVINPQDIPV